MTALVILDGAAEPVSALPTTLEAAATPALDALCRTGTVARVAPTPPDLEPGSETGIPTLLGAPPTAPVGRGLVEAAAAGIPVPGGARAWRLDLHLPDGRRASGFEATALLGLLRARLPRHTVEHLRGHRFLAVGERAPAIGGVAGLRTRVWGDGAALPPLLDDRTVVVCGPGAAAGCATLLGARVVRPAGATGDVDTDLPAKAAAALAALDDADLVVVHIGATDEAAHRHDRRGKRAAVEAADAALVEPLARAVLGAGGQVAVTSDHTTCPASGRHGAGPVPLAVAGAGVPVAGPARLTERGAAPEPVHARPWAVGAVA